MAFKVARMNRLSDGFNGFLSSWDGNAQLRRQRLAPLMGSLVASSLFTFLLSTFVANGFWLQGIPGVVLMVVVMLAETFVSNVMFTVFLVVVRGGTYGADDLDRLVKTLPQQLACFVTTYLLSAVLMVVCTCASALGSSAYNLVSTLVALFITLVNAGVAFGCYDGQKNVRKLVARAFEIVFPAFKRAAFAVVMFLLVSLVVTLGYAVVVTSQVDSYTYNIVMDFFLAGNFGMGTLAVLFNVANYVLAGYFEMDVLITAARVYDEE